MSTAAGWRSRRRVPVISAVILLALGQPAAGQAVSDEYRVKAAFVSNFPQFVEWPATVVDGRPAFDVCVLSPSPFGAVLAELLEGETARGKPLAAREVAANAAHACHLLFIPADFPRRRQLLARLHHAPVLTVSDAAGFLDEGGAIEIRLVDNRVRFDVSVEAADASGLRISAQLLRLALRVKRGKS
jgi:hypothetical protein